MAAVTLTSEVQHTNFPTLQIVRVTVATTGDTFESKFKEVVSVVVNDETTTGGASATFSGRTVTVNCTNGDLVNLWIWGHRY